MNRGVRAVVNARRSVLDWNLRLVNGLPEGVARDRFDQIESDLWEQTAAAERAGGGGRRLAAAIRLRCLRGVPADLSWSLGVRLESVLLHRLGGRRERRTAATRPWVHLEGAKPFDQTNGLVALDSGRPDDRESGQVADLVAKGVVANMINVGFGGGL